MSLFELENTLSFDEYIATFDAERVAKVHDFVDWLAQYQGGLVHNPCSSLVSVRTITARIVFCNNRISSS